MNNSRLRCVSWLLALSLATTDAFQSPTSRSSSRPGSSSSLSLNSNPFEQYNNNNNGNHHNGKDNKKEFSFAEKRSMESRLSRLERTAAATLEGFYEPSLHSFSIKPGSVNVSTLMMCSMCAVQCVTRGNANANTSPIFYFPLLYK
jgi:hypothetical protein